ncbi:phage tail sheath subtilisin-like domain-containing protein [Nitratireductor aquimarinus]|uniref:phage tail sheath subtilisin-like domain-containing protein n=1 Tax=Nitratireductor aquimarinus TaxID=889300 RepID=UPI001A8D6689|nr:phage tail sheath subtilisin-like domain-containing protein [Nitratireductor aquimarinus]MBN8243319.1 phage tail sheath subtilisin-like domain-containing protein [Nitratireductor aquimarinus]MBY6131220.1 phage tail sheath subtilisin-like domain-containing protein [Nitratireductor aquimarinus]MCA1302024.1 phage tail sheath subtilisin-like domain-containing protein [Nitratireductor aquimarinus]
MATAPYNHGVRVVQSGNEPRPIAVADVSSIGAAVVAPDADANVFPPNEPVAFFTHEADKVAALGATGNAIDIVNAVRAQGVEGRMVFVRVEEGVDEDATRANLIGSAASMTGVHGLAYALGHVGVEPDILLAPGYSAGRVENAKNPVADALEQVAAKLKAMAVFDTGGTDSASSLAYRADFSSRYTYLLDPFVRVASGETIVSKPASPFAAGLIVKKDKMKGGPYWSPSNQGALGILGTARPITYFDGEIDHEANLLNEAGIATFIPSRVVQGAGGQYAANGRILWGNRTASDDPLWKFINVVRTRATIEKSIVASFRPWANDENLSSQHVIAVLRSLQAFLDELTVIGAILGGRVIWDRGLNSNASLREGRLRVEFDAEETPPLEDLIFGSRRNEDYFDTLAEGIQRRISVEFSGSIADYISG